MIKKIITIITAIIAMFPIKSAVAISENELMTNDGNIWAVYDNLETTRDYTIIFDSLGNDNIYDDRVVRVI